MSARGLLALAWALCIAAATAAAQTTILGTCAPSDLKGAGTRAVVEWNDIGVAVGWWCPGSNNPRLYAVRWNAMNQQLRDAVDGLRSATDPASAIAAVANANATTPIASLVDVWGPIVSKLEASRPAPQIWVVAPAPSNASPPNTRPAFSWSAGVRGTVAVGRAPSGSPCNPTIGRVEGGVAYYGVNNLPNQVAVCVRGQ